MQTPPPALNNHNAVDSLDPMFSDEETEASPTKNIKIEDEEEDVPLGTLIIGIFLMLLARAFRLILVSVPFVSESQIERET